MESDNPFFKEGDYTPIPDPKPRGFGRIPLQTTPDNPSRAYYPHLMESDNPFFKDGDYTPLPDPKPRGFGRIPLQTTPDNPSRAYYPYFMENNPFFKDGAYTPIPDPRRCKPRVFGRIPLHTDSDSDFSSDDESWFPGPFRNARRCIRSKCRDICKDGGLLKYRREKGNKTIKDLCRNKHIDVNDVLVGVKYKVWLKDDEKGLGIQTFIKQSHEVEEYPFNFPLVPGSSLFSYSFKPFYCSALEIAIKNMKIGEKSSFTVKPQYGFGDEGKPAYGNEGPVPPNATLVIFVELVYWKKITYNKTLIKEGEGNDCPNEGAVVKLRLLGWLPGDDTVFFNRGYRGDDDDDLFEFKTAEEQVVEGLEEAVMDMKKGEVAVLSIPPQYAFGSSESQQELAMVPPNSPLMYRVELVSFVKEKDFEDMNNQEKIEAALEKKREGNALLAAGEDARASKRFMKALRFVGFGTSFSHEEYKIVRILRCNIFMDFEKCKTVWEGFEHSANWFNKMPELEEGTKVWNRHVQRPQEYYGGIIDTGLGIWNQIM